MSATIATTTHLNFRGNARAALEFYQSVFGGHLMVVSYADADAVQNAAEADQVLWGQVAAESGFRLMAYDVPSSLAWDPGIIPFFVSLRGTNDEEISRYWQGLSPSATVVQPLGASPWSPLYGMLKDQFGITWVLDMEPKQQAA
jgi:PhnB protein